MSTAKSKPGHGAAWANLVICGGLSWGVNLWHATHTTSGSAHVGAGLALLCATGPVVSAGFASHNMAKSGGKWFKKAMTYLVFAMGMALSITAQAEAVQGVFGNIGFGVTFALMLDLSAFMSLHSIMTVPSVERSQDQTASGPLDRVETVPGPVPMTVQDRSQDHDETVQAEPQDRSPKRSQDRSRTTAKAAPKTAAKGRVTQAEWETRVRQAVKDHPGIDLNPSPIATVLNLDAKTRASGGFKRAVSAVREETDSADHRLRAVNE